MEFLTLDTWTFEQGTEYSYVVSPGQYCWPGSRAPHRLYPRQERSRSQTEKSWSLVRKFLEIWVQAPLAQRNGKAGSAYATARFRHCCRREWGAASPVLTTAWVFKKFKAMRGGRKLEWPGVDQIASSAPTCQMTPSVFLGGNIHQLAVGLKRDKSVRLVSSFLLSPTSCVR